jgi:hypothetical protein
MATDNTGNWIRSGAMGLESVSVNFYCTSSTVLSSTGRHEKFA